MTQARKALFIAPDDVPWEFDDYAAACRALNLEPNRHCYVVCRVSTRTLLTADLGLLQDTEKADTSDQASLRSAGRSKETASGTGADYGVQHPAAPAGFRSRASLTPSLTPCERELKAEKEENAGLLEKLKEERDRRRQLEKQVEELQRQLEDAKRPYRTILPHGDMSP